MSGSSPQKKRKRSHEDGINPVRSSSGSQYVKFDAVKDAGEWGPALVLAPGLNYSFKDSMDVYSQSMSASGPFREKLLLHSAKHPKLDFVAQEEKSGDAGSLLQHYVAIHDPQTGATQVMRTRKLILRSTLQSARPRKSIEQTMPAQQSMTDSKIMLGKAFGTKKSQKAMRELLENAITSTDTKTDSQGRLILDDAAAVVIDGMGDASATATTMALSEAIDQAKPRPKANLSAQTPADVYSLEDLAGSDILPLLNVTKLKNAVRNGKNIETVSRYFSYRLTIVAATGEDKRLQALRLILILIEWRKTFIPIRGNTFRLPDKEKIEHLISDYDPALMDKLRRKFTPDVTISPWHIDNIHTHICALSLIVDEFTTDTTDLKYDLALESQKISQCFREIGCRTAPPKESEYSRFGIKTKKEASSHIIAKLRIPLVFPKMRKSKRPKQR